MDTGFQVTLEVSDGTSTSSTTVNPTIVNVPPIVGCESVRATAGIVPIRCRYADPSILDNPTSVQITLTDANGNPVPLPPVPPLGAPGHAFENVPQWATGEVVLSFDATGLAPGVLTGTCSVDDGDAVGTAQFQVEILAEHEEGDESAGATNDTLATATPLPAGTAANRAGLTLSGALGFGTDKNDVYELTRSDGSPLRIRDQVRVRVAPDASDVDVLVVGLAPAGTLFGNGAIGTNNFKNFGWQNFGWQNFGWQNFGYQNFGWQNFGWQNFGWQNFGWQNFGAETFGWQNFGWQNFGWQNFGWQNFPITDSLLQGLSVADLPLTMFAGAGQGTTIAAEDVGVDDLGGFGIGEDLTIEGQSIFVVALSANPDLDGEEVLFEVPRECQDPTAGGCPDVRYFAIVVPHLKAGPSRYTISSDVAENRKLETVLPAGSCTQPPLVSPGTSQVDVVHTPVDAAGSPVAPLTLCVGQEERREAIYGHDRTQLKADLLPFLNHPEVACLWVSMPSESLDAWDTNTCDPDQLQDTAHRFSREVLALVDANPTIENVILFGNSNVVPHCSTMGTESVGDQQLATDELFHITGSRIFTSFHHSFNLTDDLLCRPDAAGGERPVLLPARSRPRRRAPGGGPGADRREGEPGGRRRPPADRPDHPGERLRLLLRLCRDRRRRVRERGPLGRRADQRPVVRERPHLQVAGPARDAHLLLHPGPAGPDGADRAHDLVRPGLRPRVPDGGPERVVAGFGERGPHSRPLLRPRLPLGPDVPERGPGSEPFRRFPLVDWAEATDHTMIGKSGYGIGNDEDPRAADTGLFIRYAENLTQGLSSGGVKLGEALTRTKREFVGSQWPTLDPYASKATMTTLLMGVPQTRLVPTAGGAAALQATAQAMAATSGVVTPVGNLTLEVREDGGSTTTTHAIELEGFPTGSVHKLDGVAGAAAGHAIMGRVYEREGTPPSGGPIRTVLLRGADTAGSPGIYEDLVGFDPVMSNMDMEWEAPASTILEPNGCVPTFSPGRWAGVNRLDDASETVIIGGATFRCDLPLADRGVAATSGTLRMLHKASFELRKAAAGTETDENVAIIRQQDLTGSLQTGEVTVRACAEDASGSPCSACSSSSPTTRRCRAEPGRSTSYKLENPPSCVDAAGNVIPGAWPDIVIPDGIDSFLRLAYCGNDGLCRLKTNKSRLLQVVPIEIITSIVSIGATTTAVIEIQGDFLAISADAQIRIDWGDGTEEYFSLYDANGNLQPFVTVNPDGTATVRIDHVYTSGTSFDMEVELISSNATGLARKTLPACADPVGDTNVPDADIISCGFSANGTTLTVDLGVDGVIDDDNVKYRVRFPATGDQVQYSNGKCSQTWNGPKCSVAEGASALTFTIRAAPIWNGTDPLDAGLSTQGGIPATAGSGIPDEAPDVGSFTITP